MSGDEIFGYGWREDHARAGDEALSLAKGLARNPGQRRVVERQEFDNGGWSEIASTNEDEALRLSAVWTAIAAAHYAAANIRTRPIRDVELGHPGG